MKTLVIYDSAFGNTEKAAEAIAGSIGGQAVLIKDVKDQMLDGLDMLFLGTPTQGGMATEPIKRFIDSLNPGKHKFKIAVFDTRFDIDGHGLRLKLLMKTIGFASPKMAKKVKARGMEVAGSPEGFIVSDKEGPLRQGEIERAVQWAEKLAEAGR